MPMSRYQIRNEYSLADPELYGAADKDDPEALLEGVAMAGLVGVLRQLGDLAEFAAEIFHDLHEEVMATATRGHGLTVRVKQLETEFPLIEKAFLSQTSPSAFFSNAGTDWHPNLHTNQNLITGGDLPRFIMDSYEECRGPPRLFLLDKFDVAGAGACLKRYTDPSFFKVEVSSYGLSSAEDQKEKRSRKSKKKGSRWRNAGTPEYLPASHAKLHQLFLEERVENGVSDPARLVKLKRRFNGFPYSKTGKSFMEKFINAALPEDKLVHEITYGSSSLELPSETVSELGIGLPQTTGVSSLKESTNVESAVQRPSVDEVFEDLSDKELSFSTRQYPLEVVYEKEIAVDGESKTDGYQSDDVASEVDNYMDALATMESEIDTETAFRTKYDISIVDLEKQGTDYNSKEALLQVQYSDSQSTRNSNASDDGNNSIKKGSSSFSYSDTGSIAAENVTVDIAAKVSPSSHVSEAEVCVMSIEKFSKSEELSPTQHDEPPKLNVSDDTSNEVREIPSYRSESGELSSSLYISDSSPTHLPLDENLARGTLRVTHMLKTFSSNEEPETKFIKTEENNRNRGNNIPWNSRRSRIPSQTQADEPPTETVSSVNHNSDKLGNDPINLSNASIQISENIPEIIPKKYGSESSMNNLLEAEHQEDICTEDLVDSQISPLHSVNLHVEDEPSAPAFLDSQTSNTVLQPEVVDSVYVSPLAKEISVNSDFASDCFENSSVAEQGVEWTNNVSPINIASALDTCHEEKTAERVLHEADSNEIDEITRSTGLTGSEAAALNNLTDYLNSSGRSSLTEYSVPSKADDVGMGEISSSLNLVGGEAVELESTSVSVNTRGPRSLLDDKEAKVSQSENSIVATVDEEHDSDADKVDSSYARSLPTDYSHSTQELDQSAFEVYDKSLPNNFDEAGRQTSEVYQEIASSDSDYVRSETAFSRHSGSEMVSYVTESFLSAEAGSSLQPEQSTFREHSDDSLPLLTHHVPEPGTRLEQKGTVEADQLEESKSKDVSEPEQLSCLDHLDEGSIDAHFEHSLHTSKPVVPVIIPNDSLIMESLYGDEASVGLSSKLDTNYSDDGGNSITSPRSSSVLHPDEAINSALPQLRNNEADVSEQGVDPLNAIHPDFPLLLEVPQVDLPEIPPMPPLPPVQWRLGRTQQHASMPSYRDSQKNTIGIFQPTFSFKTNNTTQIGYPAFNRDDMLFPAPVLPLSAVESEDHQHVNEHVLSNMTHSDALSMQMPVTSSHRYSQDDLQTSDSTSNMNPLLRLSSTDNENPSHGISASEEGSMQSSSTPSSSVTTNGDPPAYISGSVPSHHSNQMRPEVPPEPESISVSAEVRVIKFLDTSSPQAIVPDEQPTYVATTSESETVWSTSNASSPAMEDGTLNGNRQMKLLRPRTPLIDAVAAHDKSMLRKVTERARPEVQKVEERDTLLEQIRAKSFNLKPAVVTRPSIQGPKTNLRVAAILEKANAIRQALAGSDDEDEDEDSWSDS